MFTFTVVYDPIRGGCLPDGCQESWVNHIIKVFNKDQKSYLYHVGNFNIINYFRLSIANDDLDVNKFALIFEGDKVEVDEFGFITHWPIGMAWDVNEVHSKILLAGSEKRQRTMHSKSQN